MFGIIAGVLIGVWAMYTLLGDNSDVQAVVAEVRMIREAAVTYKNAGGTNDYSPLASAGDVALALTPYLGESDLADGWNIFGEGVSLYLQPYPAGQDLVMEYPGIPSIETCRRILEHFGEVTEVLAGEEFMIEPGKTISGYVGGDAVETGCTIEGDKGYLCITID